MPPLPILNLHSFPNLCCVIGEPFLILQYFFITFSKFQMFLQITTTTASNKEGLNRFTNPSQLQLHLQKGYWTVRECEIEI